MVSADPETAVVAPPSPSPVNDPLKIVEDYTVDSSGQVRENAAAALVVLASTHPRALDVLAEMLLNERDDATQLRLEAQVLKLPAELAGGFLKRLLQREARNGVWPWLARLRMSGFGVGEKEPIEALIRLAIDSSGHTRSRAVNTLAGLTGDEQKAAARGLLDFLKLDDRRFARETYELLGLLRSRGSLLGHPSFLHEHEGNGGGWRNTLRRLRGRIWGRHSPSCIVNEPDIVERRQASFGLIWMVVGWAALGAVAMAIYLSTGSPAPAPAFYAPFVLGVAVIGGLLGFAATRGATPIDRHYSRLAAGIREALAAALRALLPAVLVLGAVLALAGFDPGTRNWLRVVVETSLGICVFIAAIRAGTVVAFGVMPQGRPGPQRQPAAAKPMLERDDRLPRTSEAPGFRTTDRKSAFASSRWNFIAQIAVGTGAGLAVATVFLIIARLQRDPSVTTGMARLSEGLWIVLLPTAAGIASAFAWIDAPSGNAEDARSSDDASPKPVKFGIPIQPGRERRLYGVARVVSALLALALAFGGLAIAWMKIHANAIAEQLPIATSGQPYTHPRIPIGALPFEAAFAVGFPQRVSLDIPEQPRPPTSDTEPDFVLELFEWKPRGSSQGHPDCSSRTGKRRVQTEDDPPKIERVLGWGCYTAEVTSTAIPESGLISVVTGVLDARVAGSGNGPASRYSLAMTLNSGSDQGRVFADGAASGSGVWLLNDTRMPRIEIDAPTTLQLFLSSVPANLQADDAPAQASTAPTAGTNNSEQYPFAIEIVKHSAIIEDDALRERVTLPPGSYTLELKPTEGKQLRTAGIAINMLAAQIPQRPPPSRLTPLAEGAMARPKETVSGYWAIGSQLPTAHPFRVTYAQEVEINLISIQDPDPLGLRTLRPPAWLVEVRPGTRSGVQDDLAGIASAVASVSATTPRRKVMLQPGDYYLLAITRSQRSRASSTASAGLVNPVQVSPQLGVVELTLNVPKPTPTPSSAR